MLILLPCISYVHGSVNGTVMGNFVCICAVAIGHHLRKTAGYRRGRGDHRIGQ